MITGSLLLVAHSALESQIITSFLEAADYQVADFGSWRQAAGPRLTDFDAAVLVIEDEDPDLAETCAQIRETTRQEHLPLVVVATQSPATPIGGLCILMRPIRLFDLVHTLEQIIAATQHDDPHRLYPRQTTIHA